MFLTPSTASSATSLTLETTFSAAPSFSSSLSPINLPTPSLTVPVAWFNFSSVKLLYIDTLRSFHHSIC